MQFTNWKTLCFGLFIGFGLIFISNLIGELLMQNAHVKTSNNLNYSTRTGDRPVLQVNENLPAQQSGNVLMSKAPIIKKSAENNSAQFAKGAKAFKQCKPCHSISEGGKKKIGPNLWKVFERKIGTLQGYKYSAVMQGRLDAWDEYKLDAFLTRPKDFYPGTKMLFSGIQDPGKRQDLIYFLKTVNQNGK
jgi:cytochrome c